MIASTPLYPPMPSTLTRSARLPLALLLGAFVLWGVANATVMPHDAGLTCPLDLGRSAMGGTEAGYAAHNGAIVSISETRLVAGTLRMVNATIHDGKTAAAHIDIDIAVAAPGQALGNSAPLSPQGFVPSLQATLIRMGAQIHQYVTGGGLEITYNGLSAKDEYSRVTPFAAGRYSRFRQDDYTGDAAFKPEKFERGQFSTTVGLRGARDFVLADDSVVVTPHASIAWLHNWTDDGLPAAGNFPGTPMRFNSRARAQERDAAQFGAGLDLRFKQESGWDFGVKAAYGLDLRAGNTGHALFGGFEIRF